MNKIYKVIWSKVKNQYVVVSELAHSNGKQSRTSRNSIRSRIAALVVCGAITAFGVYGALPNSAFAEVAGGEATQSQYIAIAIEGNPGKGNNDATWHNGRWPWDEGYWELNNEKVYGDYTYIRQTVTVGDSQKQYWVRKGYDITAIQGKRHKSINDNTDYIIDAKKNAQYDASSDQGLLQAYQTTTSVGKITTLTGVNIENLDTGVYGGASNTSGVTTPATFGYHIKVGGDGAASDGYIRVTNDPYSSNRNFNTYFSYDINLENNGSYSYINSNGEKVIVPDNKIYSIDGKLGVFTDAKGNLYTGDVYGDNNEILLSGSDGNKIYSYWGTKINDLSQTIGNMTLDAYNNDRKKLQDQAATYHGDDITNITVKKATEGNGGTLSLNRVGIYNDQTGDYTSTTPVPGTITITSEGGTDGSGAEHDVKIKFSNTDEQGEEHSFTVDAGSKVEAVIGDNDKVSRIKINGVDYQLSAGGVIGGSIDDNGNVNITQDGQETAFVGKVQDWNVTSANLDDNGTLTLNTENAYGGDTGSVTVDNIASRGYVTNQIDANNTTITQKYENYFNTNDKYLSGATFDNNSGELKLTVAKAGENGAAQEYSFDLGKYVEGKDVYVNQISIDKENNKLILNRKNATSLELGLEELSSIGVSSSDYQLIGSGDGTGTYTPDESGNISLQVKDSVSGDIKTVQLKDVASATKLGEVNTQVNTNTSNITSLGDRVTNVENDTITGGNIGNDGTVTLTKKGTGTEAITLAGKVQDWNVTSANLDDNGTLTLNTENAYGGDTGSVTVDNIASRGYVTNQIDANNTTITQKYENYFNTNDKYLSGATFDNNSGELKLTVAKAGENGAAQEYSFDLGKYVEGKDVYVNDELSIQVRHFF